MTPRYLYSTSADASGGLAYDAADEMAAWLHTHPLEVDAYALSMWRTAQSSASWGDYRGARGITNMLWDVMIALAKLRGDKYLD